MGRATPAPEVGGTARGQVSEVQRARMLAAMTDACAERGAPNVTISYVVARAGVSRRTYYELFPDRESCLLAAFESALGHVYGRIAKALDASRGWREQMRAAVLELLLFLDDEPAAARLLVVESLAAGPEVLERRARAVERAVAFVDAGRSEATRGGGPPVLTAEGVVGAVCAVLHARLREDDSNPLLGIANELMAMIVLPYLGAAAARRELARGIPVQASGRARRETRDPLRELDMRVTYRTIRVLEAVAANPGSSSREVGAVAGVIDQGQISKLLARLDSLGLVTDTAVGATRGRAKEWKLTRRGAAVRDVIAGGLRA
jgi:AcrR family transcriptional regulator